MDYRKILISSIRLYFAPLVGAYRGWRAEMLRHGRRYRDCNHGKSVALGMWNDFVKGFIKGAKETPRGFFAPAVAIWRLLLDTTESLVKPK